MFLLYIQFIQYITINKLPTTILNSRIIDLSYYINFGKNTFLQDYELISVKPYSETWYIPNNKRAVSVYKIFHSLMEIKNHIKQK